jgi:hypothetical protein
VNAKRATTYVWFLFVSRLAATFNPANGARSINYFTVGANALPWTLRPLTAVTARAR